MGKHESKPGELSTSQKNEANNAALGKSSKVNTDINREPKHSAGAGHDDH